MDEPFGAVDPIVRTRLQDELVALQRTVHKTIVLVTHDLDEALRVADRIALMNVGGVIAQLATPDELLRRPADRFVEEFIGDDRGLRRLGLNLVSSVPFNQGPVVASTATATDVAHVLGEHVSDWLGVTVDGGFGGWVPADVALEAVRARGSLDAVDLALPAAQVVPGDTLRSAMELIMSSNTSVAVIDDGGRFGGVITLEDIRRALSEHRE
jgi:osmoprotectant transport system ATP-binding protein